MGIVRENIDFQRRLEPKQAMDLGLTQKWLSIRKDDILIIKRNFTTDSQNHIDDESKYNNFKEGDSFEVNTGPEKYSDGTIGFTGYISDNIVRSSDDRFIWGTPLELDQRLEILQGLPHDIKEAQNFERGIEPMDSMKIGRVGERDIKKVLNLLVDIRGGRYKINHFEDWIEGTYYMGPRYEKIFRADNLFIRYYPAQGTSVDHFSFGYRIKDKVMKEKILSTAEEGLTEILNCITPLPHG